MNENDAGEREWLQESLSHILAAATGDAANLDVMSWWLLEDAARVVMLASWRRPYCIFQWPWNK